MNERHHRLLLDCYLSGQVSEAQWQEHLKDRDFAEFIAKEMGLTPDQPASGRSGAADQYVRTSPGNTHREIRLEHAAFEAGWNARKQLDYETMLGIRRQA